MNAKGNFEKADGSFKSATRKYTVSSPNITTAVAKSETAKANYVNAKRNYEKAKGSFNTAKRNYKVSNPNITKAGRKNKTAKEKNILSAQYLSKMLCPTLKSTSNKHQLLILTECSNRVAYNEQGLLQGWNSLLVRPEPLLIKDIKVQVNKQKPSDVCPAKTKAQQR